MALTPGMRQATATIPRATYAKLERIAKHRGLSLHAFMNKLLAGVAERTPEPSGEPAMPIDQSAEKFGEMLMVEVSLDLGLRLHSAARQMRDERGQPLNPTALARMILIDAYEAPCGFAERIQRETDPAYVDIVPFTGQMTKPRNFKSYHLLIVRMLFSTKQAILAAAQEDNCSMAVLVRKALDDYLPHLPE